MRVLTAACFLGLVSHAFSAGLHALVTSPLGGVGYVVRGPGANQYHGASIESIEALGQDYRGAGALAHGAAGATSTQNAQVAAFLSRGISDYRISGVTGGQFAVSQGGSALLSQAPRTVVTETTTASQGAGGVYASQRGVASLSQTTGGVGTLVGHVPGSVVVTETTSGAAHGGSAVVSHVPGTVVTETTRTDHAGVIAGHTAGTLVGQTPGVVVTETRETVPGQGVLVGHGGVTVAGQVPGVVVTETRTTGADQGVLVGQAPQAVLTETRSTGAGHGVLVGHGGATLVSQTPGVVVTETRHTGTEQGVLVRPGGATVVSQTPGVVVTQGARAGQGVLVGQGGTAGGLLFGQRGATVVSHTPGTIVTETTRAGQAGLLVGHGPSTAFTGTQGYGLFGVGGTSYGIATTPGSLVYRPGYGYGAAYRTAYIATPGYTVVRPGAYSVGGIRYATATTSVPGSAILQHPIGAIVAFQPAAGIEYRTHTAVTPTYVIRRTPAHGLGLFGYGYGLGGYRYGVPTGLGYHSGAAVHTGTRFGLQAVGVSAPTTLIHQTPGAGYHAVSVPGALVHHAPIYGQALFGYGFGLGGHRYTIPSALGGHHVATGLLDLGRSAGSHIVHSPGAAYQALGLHVGSAPVAITQHAPAGAVNVGYGLGGVRYHAVSGSSAVLHHGAAYTISSKPTITYQATAPQVITYRIASPAVTVRAVSPSVTYRTYKTTYTAPVAYNVLPATNRKKK